MLQLILNNAKWIGVSITLAVLLAIIPPVISAALIFLLLSVFLFNRYKNLILPLIILSYLSITSDYIKDFRIVVNLFSTILLLFVFLKKYGLRFEDYPKLPNGMVTFQILLFITLIISTIYSSFPIVSLLAVLRMFLFMVIVYLLYALIQSKDDILTYLYSIIVVMLIIGIPMLIDAYNLGIEKYFMRVVLSEKFDLLATTRYSSFTIFFITLTIETSFIFFKKRQSQLTIIATSVLIIFNIIILILANSRGGILATIFSIGFMLFVLSPKLFLKSSFALILVSLVLFFSVKELNQAVTNYLRLETVSDREVYWQMGIDVINDNPVVGVGVDVFDKFFFNYAPSRTVNYFKSDFLNIGKPHPHNFFLFFTAENGILGLISSISFFVMFFYYAIKAMQLTKNRDYDYYVLTVMITGIGVGLFFRSFVEVTGYLIYGYITRDLPFWLLFGILIFIYQKFSNIENQDPSKISSIKNDRY